MLTSYEMNSEELTPEFIKIIKKIYKNKRIEITISEIDETEYILRSPQNKKALLNRLKDIEENINIVEPEKNEFE